MRRGTSGAELACSQPSATLYQCPVTALSLSLDGSVTVSPSQLPLFPLLLRAAFFQACCAPLERSLVCS